MFKYVDCVLFTFGVKIHRKSRWIVILNHLFFLYFAFDVAWCITSSIAIGTYKSHRLVFVEYSALLWCCLFSQSLLRNKRKKIMMLERSVKISLSSTAWNRLQQLDANLTMIHVLAIAIPMAVHVVWPIIQLRIPHASEALFFWRSELHTGHYTVTVARKIYKAITIELFMHISLLLYVYFAAAIEWSKQVTVEKVCQASRITLDTLQHLVVKLQHYDSIKQQFDDIFSIFPLFWLSYLFLGAAGFLSMGEQIIDLSDIGNLLLQLMFLEQMLLCFGCLYYVNSQIAQSEMNSGQLRRRLYNHMSVVNMIQSNMISCVQRELDREVHYTCAGLFQLKNQFVLQFVNALISFTVMFLQFR